MRQSEAFDKNVIVNSTDGLIAASAIVKQHATLAYRIVLHEWNGKIVVHDELFPNWPQLDESYFETGNYFRKSQLPEALNRFAERTARQADFVRSIYRDCEMV
jgi:hypothetical protein